MSINSSCCFCNKNIKNGNAAHAPNSSYSEEQRANFFQQNHDCQKCLNDIIIYEFKYISSLSVPIKDDAMECISELRFFVPGIDKDLLPRFVKMLVGLEEYSFSFSSKEALRLLIPKELIVAKNMVVDGENRFIPHFENSNVLVTKKFEVRNISLTSNVTKYLYRKLFDSISSKQLTIKAERIVLRDLKITPKKIYQLLSSQLTELKCFKVKFTSLINPIDFIEKLPNIKKFLFSDTYYTYLRDTQTIDESETLPFNCQAFKQFCIPFKSLNLSLPEFTGIIKKWSKNQRTIFIYLHDPDDGYLINSPLDNYIQVTYDSLMKTNL